ncbi:hypothetical protein E2562_012500 [Oryza meyeriana var. granulata]|uniref:Uncharacterized protein n=1 Tax=Oryza meyeriana var. granulata TaxID=110450 RepID=A0A6G1BV88_9ORYZ|nr:hypothetical protein E2562_012500 [Oryza meyeriana var. granulata]
MSVLVSCQLLGHGKHVDGDGEQSRTNEQSGRAATLATSGHGWDELVAPCLPLVAPLEHPQCTRTLLREGQTQI